MRPFLEQISKTHSSRSFQYRRLELPAFPHFWHYHPEIELTFIEKGRGIRYVGDNISLFEEGDLVLLGENLPHTWVTQGEQVNEIQSAYVFQFPIGLLQQFPELSHLVSFLHQAKNGFLFNHPSREIIETISNFGNLNPTSQLLSLIDLIARLENSPKTEISNSNNSSLHFIEKEQKKIDRVKNYLHNNFQEQIELAKISELMHMSPTYFCRWFKRAIGHTFITYLNKLRIEQACRWLISTDWDVSEIAYKTGFQHVIHFNRVFKKEKKVSPLGYRSQINKKTYQTEHIPGHFI
ncbi:AraC family transcriptional regulator [Shivajiella indica]|uniref:AraC family transcriptional regulator n=1 Tax=Shivajiella indica TaxID=872115 RepID=A0ABW5B915_9BACT